MRNERSRINKIKNLCETLSPEARLEIKGYLELLALERVIESTKCADQPPAPLPTWWTIPEVAEFVERDRTLVWRDARKGKFLTNGQRGRAVRIHKLSVLHYFVSSTLRLSRRVRSMTYGDDRRAAADEVIDFAESLQRQFSQLVELARARTPPSKLPPHLKRINISAQFLELCRRWRRAGWTE